MGNEVEITKKEQKQEKDDLERLGKKLEHKLERILENLGSCI
jgi:hypothetical protein